MTDMLYQNKEAWYEITKKHWEQSEGSDNGMLGGNPQLHESDIKASISILDFYTKKNIIKTDSCLELGAGIGRVTKSLLKDYFTEIYIVEQDKKFSEVAKESLKDFSQVKGVINLPMQSTFSDLKLNDMKFNCIWIQWCIENLHDDDLVELLKQCKLHLSERGVIFIKENVVEDNSKIAINTMDYSRVRSDAMFKELFKKAGLKIFKHQRHPDWPSEDFMDVSIFILM